MNTNSQSNVLVVLAILAVVGVGGFLAFSGGEDAPKAVQPTGALTGPDIESPYLSVNKLRTEIRRGDFADATTTLVAILNPYAATATVRFISLDINMGTTTATFKVGTSTTAYPNLASACSAGMVNAAVATSGTAYLTNAGFNILDNGLAGEATMEIGPTEYFCVHASSTNAQSGHNGGILGGNNSFTGSFVAQFMR